MVLDAYFWPALWGLAIDANTRPEVLLTVWFAESALDPSAQNSLGCIGLNQTCPASVGGPGFPSTPEAYRSASASEQVAWIAPQVLAQARLNGGGFRSAARYYQANFLPATLATAKRPTDVIAARGGPYAAAYEANRGLDFSGDGAITLADLGDYLARVVLERGIDVDHGAPLETAIRTAYSAPHLPSNAPWRSAELVVREPEAAPVRPRRGGTGVLVTLAGLVGALAMAKSGGRA
jgi:hypothetical protein